jgi:hypothetical protein
VSELGVRYLLHLQSSRSMTRLGYKKRHKLRVDRAKEREAHHRHLASIGPRRMSTYRPPPPPPSPKKKKPPVWMPQDAGISKEVSWLRDDIAANPCPESTQPRKEPAMSRYHGALLKPRPQPRERRRHSCQSRKKAKRPMESNEVQQVLATTLTEPEAASPPMMPEVPTPVRRSEVTSRMEPHVIDLTGED